QGITTLIADLQSGIADLEALKAAEHDQGDAAAHCMFIKDKVLPQMLIVRAIVDELETIVADDLWPLPTFQEMLFIK
ncbi:MAG: glutamine synthetase type III, partial [Pseudomonadota bacterium]